MTITRTIKATYFKVNVYNMADKKMEEKEITVSGDKTEESKEYKKAVKDFEKDFDGWYKVLDVVERDVVSGLYAMEESEFLKYATRIGDGR